MKSFIDLNFGAFSLMSRAMQWSMHGALCVGLISLTGCATSPVPPPAPPSTAKLPTASAPVPTRPTEPAVSRSRSVDDEASEPPLTSGSVEPSESLDSKPEPAPRKNQTAMTSAPMIDPASVKASSWTQKGPASWYGTYFHGRKTANGEIYDMHAMTAAHRTLPLPSYVRVRNVRNGKAVVVRVNDRGPYSGNRILDLSYAAARELGMVSQGVGHVVIEKVTVPGAAQGQKKPQRSRR